MDKICDKNKCSGCSACYNVCRHSAIEMVADACGYIYPRIDETKCVNCKLCQLTCPVNNPLKAVTPVKCYAAIVKNEVELLSSSSGGLATAISKMIIQNGGVVYGCSGESPRFVHHERIDNIYDLERLKGSKYVQSYIGKTIRLIKEDLKNNLIVCFIGTPCQVAGVKNSFKEVPQKLLLIDLVCHGVPSQKMLNDNLLLYCKQNEEVRLAFRRKEKIKEKFVSRFGWELTRVATNKTRFFPYNKDYYMFGFLRCLTFRESCYSCQYANSQRISDITLCDFWGLGKDCEVNQDKGVSAVLINNDRGKYYFDLMKADLYYQHRTVDEAVAWNNQLKEHCTRPKHYDIFTQTYEKSSFKKAMIKAYWSNYILDYYIKMKNKLRPFYYKCLNKK